MGVEQQLESDAVAYFNGRLRVAQIKAIGAEEMRPSKVEGTAAATPFCQSPECRQLSTLYRGLVMGPDGLPYGSAQRETTEWQGRLKDYLAALARWEDDPAASHGSQFRQKCLIYSDLSNIVPNGPDRTAVLRSFLDFLQRSDYQRENRMEWFLPVNGLVARVSLDPAALGETWHELRGARDPVIALYATLEQLLPRPPGVRLSIM